VSETNSGAVGGAIKSSDDVREMFDGIVPRYDLLNRLMTGGRDVAWRKLAVREATRHVNPATASILDIATGTGDLALELERAGVASVVGLDFSAPMLREAERKALERPEGPSLVSWVQGDAMALPFAADTFDAVTVGFGLRNMPDYLGALREVVRVLKPGGTFVCLETSPLPSPVLRAAFETTMRVGLPVLGGVLSGDREAYAYLPQSSAVFPDADALGKLLQVAGLTNVRYLRRGLGAVAVHVGRKPPIPDQAAVTTAQ
jgi:demethylmenaquinone methyltransferase / 2-methoxy-6-polyprenyl-1,4-benzoquinol methylase